MACVYFMERFLNLKHSLNTTYLKNLVFVKRVLITNIIVGMPLLVFFSIEIV